MPTIDATVGGASANSYLELVDARAYYSERLGVPDVVTSASDEVLTLALITAFRRINAEVYRGTRSTIDQAGQFPRTGIYIGGQVTDGMAIAREAQAEEALALLVAAGADADQNPFAATGLEPFSDIGVGDIRLSMRERDVNDASVTLSPQAYRLLRPYIITTALSGPPAGARAVRLWR